MWWNDHVVDLNIAYSCLNLILLIIYLPSNTMSSWTLCLTIVTRAPLTIHFLRFLYTNLYLESPSFRA